MSRKFHLKLKFYIVKMNSLKNLETNLDDFKKITSDLSSIDYIVDDKTYAINLFSSLLEKYKDARNGILYGRDDLLLDLVVFILRPKELELSLGDKDHSNNEALMAKGRFKWSRKCKV